eukprot:760226-Hanusia_phi.AAC.1
MGYCCLSRERGEEGGEGGGGGGGGGGGCEQQMREGKERERKSEGNQMEGGAGVGGDRGEGRTRRKLIARQGGGGDGGGRRAQGCRLVCYFEAAGAEVKEGEARCTGGEGEEACK